MIQSELRLCFWKIKEKNEGKRELREGEMETKSIIIFVKLKLK